MNMQGGLQYHRTVHINVDKHNKANKKTHSQPTRIQQSNNPTIQQTKNQSNKQTNHNPQVYCFLSIFEFQIWCWICVFTEMLKDNFKAPFFEYVFYTVLTIVLIIKTIIVKID